ncbi:UNVERIFIED_CONTAM: hypothetical protein Slati_1131600 [Sesamum latifolium]|uniref:CCHC-type domain-containing protein n=1 Tax=Sesamum latifolium TaxID=2727402 RepID=A0AAW2XD46_9LAMI
MFDKWLEDNRKVRSIILALMTNVIQKQYDRLDYVPSIMLRMKEVYAVPDRHIRHAAIKVFFGTKMTKGSSVQSHGVKMFSLVEKLEDLKVGLNNDTYIDERLRPPKQKARGPDAGRGIRARERGAPAAPTGKGKGKVGGSQRSRTNDVCMHCQGKGHWKRECPQLLSNPGMLVVEVN